MRTSIVRARDCYDPPRAVRRELRTVLPAEIPAKAPPVLLVPGLGRGAEVYAEHWLEHIAERDVPAYAMSPRGQGTSEPAPDAQLRDYVHDVVQVAAGLPRQAVLVGHGVGALVVALALSRYPARAAVLAAPVFGGVRSGLAALRGYPGWTLRGLGGGVAGRVPRQLLRWQSPEPPVGNPPMLVLGSPEDRLVGRTGLERTARHYGQVPLLFPGLGHDLMLDPRWPEPVEAILDWLAKLPDR